MPLYFKPRERYVFECACTRTTCAGSDHPAGARCNAEPVMSRGKVLFAGWELTVEGRICPECLPKTRNITMPTIRTGRLNKKFVKF